MATAPATAQIAAAPTPAPEARLGSNGESAQWRTEYYVIGALLLILAVWGLVEILDDNNDSVSPD